MVLSSTIFDSFADTRTVDEYYDRKQFWRHSIGVGACSKVIAGKLGMSTMLEEFFIAGLLHDIGKILIDQFMHEDFEKILKIVHEKNCLMYDAELEVLQATHCEVGGLLTRKWGISPMASAVVEYHHQPDLAGEFIRPAGIVHLADIIVRAMCIGSGGDRKIPCINAAAWTNLGFTLNDLDVIMEYTQKELEGAMVFMEFIK